MVNRLFHATKVIFSVFCLVFLVSCGKDYSNGPKQNIENENSITLVSIPADSFRMGDISGDGESNELPVHSVSISSFEMGVYEVTKDQYESLMGVNLTHRFRVGDQYPVYYVDWYDSSY